MVQTPMWGMSSKPFSFGNALQYQTTLDSNCSLPFECEDSSILPPAFPICKCGKQDPSQMNLLKVKLHMYKTEGIIWHSHHQKGFPNSAICKTWMIVISNVVGCSERCTEDALHSRGMERSTLYQTPDQDSDTEKSLVEMLLVVLRCLAKRGPGKGVRCLTALPTWPQGLRELKKKNNYNKKTLIVTLSPHDL